MTPPEYIVNPYDPSPFLVTENPDHFLWFTRAYMYCLYASAGASFALVVVSNYAAAWDLAVIRDADWIRIMSRHGDNVLWWQVWFLAITLGGIILTCCINIYMVYWNNISGWEESKQRVRWGGGGGHRWCAATSQSSTAHLCICHRSLTCCPRVCRTLDLRWHSLSPTSQNLRTYRARVH